MHHIRVKQPQSTSTELVCTRPSHLSEVASLGSALLRKCGNDINRVMDDVGTEFLVPHVNTIRIHDWFGSVMGFPRIRLVRVLSLRASVDVAAGGDLEEELEYVSMQ